MHGPWFCSPGCASHMQSAPHPRTSCVPAAADVGRPCSVQQSVICNGPSGEAAWSAWPLCSLGRDRGAPERRVVQIDVKQGQLNVLHKAVVKHTFQVSQGQALLF